MSFEIDKVKKLLEPYNIFPQEIMELDGYASTNFRAKSEENNYLLKLYKDSSEYKLITCLLYTSPSPRDQRGSRMPSSA